MPRSRATMIMYFSNILEIDPRNFITYDCLVYRNLVVGPNSGGAAMGWRCC
jgi:hypothetical protein